MNLSTSVQNRASPVCVRNRNLKPATSGSETPEAQCSHTTKNALKVLEILKNFFQEVFKQGLGQRPKVLEVLICMD